MKVLRRNWMTLVTVFSLALLATVLWRSSSTHALAVEPPYEPISVVQRDAILKVLADTALDEAALVALNPSAEQAESILATARTWQSQNAATLAAKQADIDSALTSLRSLQKLMAMGSAQEGQDAALASAVATLISARAAYQITLDSLRSGVNSVLSESQRVTWTAVQTGHDSTMPMRMLALTDPQRISISDQWHEFESERAGDRAAAAAEWQSDANETLTQDQETVVSSFNSNFAVASQVVSDAVALVLPMQVQS